uniref:Augerpeptide hhe1a n=1 Tax=Hastula hectica TaxID=745793 RepID=TEIA_HASHE|nr:RecName: Full=Augerpeptide hhe1a [Hastula hectica]
GECCTDCAQTAAANYC